MKFWIFTILLGLIALANSCGGEDLGGGAAANIGATRMFRPVGLPPGAELLAGCAALVTFDAQRVGEDWTIYGTIAVADEHALVMVENVSLRKLYETNPSSMDRVFMVDRMPARDGDLLRVSYRVSDTADCTSSPTCRRVMGSVSVPERCP
jgi:hypothetical protein